MSKGGNPPKSYGRDSGRGFNPRSSVGLNLQHTSAIVSLRTFAMSDQEPRAAAPRLPDFFAAPAPDAPRHPDADLIELAEKTLAGLVRYRDAMADFRDGIDNAILHPQPSADRMRALQHIIVDAEQTRRVTMPMLRQASKLKAQTPAGIMAKALLMRASTTGAAALARSLAIDLVESPALRAAVWPAPKPEAAT
jgi:hypothetical protein